VGRTAGYERVAWGAHRSRFLAGGALRRGAQSHAFLSCSAGSCQTSRLVRAARGCDQRAACASQLAVASGWRVQGCRAVVLGRFTAAMGDSEACGVIGVWGLKGAQSCNGKRGKISSKQQSGARAADAACAREAREGGREGGRKEAMAIVAATGPFSGAVCSCAAPDGDVSRKVKGRSRVLGASYKGRGARTA
jgi:hypothetical protein